MEPGCVPKGWLRNLCAPELSMTAVALRTKFEYSAKREQMQ